jgi:hypothetical protein
MPGITHDYDTPKDIKYTPKPFWGLSTKYAGMLAVAAGMAYGWHELTARLGFGTDTDVFRFGFLTILAISLAFVMFRLDIVAYRIARWWMHPYAMNRSDRKAKEISGIVEVEHDWYLNRYGDACSIMQLSAMNSDRVEGINIDTVINGTKTFLNSLPCPVQLIRYSFPYPTENYIDSMLKNAESLPKKHQEYLITHLEHYKRYCTEENIQEPLFYLVIKTDGQSKSSIETLNMNAKVIESSIKSARVYANRLSGAEITTAILMLTSGIGKPGLDYLSEYVEVKI